MTHRPTAKQESFAVAYFRLGNATAAHREAYAPKTMSDKTINEAASRLLKNGKVAARISELTAPVLKSTGLTVGPSLQEVATISYSDPRRLYREDGSLKRSDEWDDDFGRSRKKSHHCLIVNRCG